MGAWGEWVWHSAAAIFGSEGRAHLPEAAAARRGSGGWMEAVRRRRALGGGAPRWTRFPAARPGAALTFRLTSFCFDLLSSRFEHSGPTDSRSKEAERGTFQRKATSKITFYCRHISISPTKKTTLKTLVQPN